MIHDRVKPDEFRLTQEFLSHMLSVRLATVSLHGRVFPKQEIINYGQGYIMILNRADLEAIACQCYQIIRGESDQALN
jgi:hypothetical protein